MEPTTWVRHGDWMYDLDALVGAMDDEDWLFYRAEVRRCFDLAEAWGALMHHHPRMALRLLDRVRYYAPVGMRPARQLPGAASSALAGMIGRAAYGDGHCSIGVPADGSPWPAVEGGCDEAA